MHQDTFLMRKSSLPPPPYKPNDPMYDLIVKAKITGFFSDTQKAVMKAGAIVGGAALLWSRL